MSTKSVLNRVEARISQDSRGDRGWFLLTRVHVRSHWVKGVIDYIYQRAGRDAISLDRQDYQHLATITQISGADPSIQLRRHHLLALYKPLQLIERLQPRSWASIRLSEQGVRLAESDYFAPTLDHSLSSIMFAHGSAVSEDRQAAYSQFNINVFSALSAILHATDGYIDRDEFDYFVSRVRSDDEIQWAIDGILDYRTTMSQLSDREKKSLSGNLASIVHRGLTRKEYQNWRDIALHTFSLFDIGSKMSRQGRHLWLTERWGEGITATSTLAGRSISEGNLEYAKGTKEKQKPQNGRLLKIPTPLAPQELMYPPQASRQGNTGVEAENLVAKILQSQGWSVAFYSAKRGFGFDLWARKANSAMVIEVKSSLNKLLQVTLTDNELQAAKHYGENYVLALVELAHSESPEVWFIPNPGKNLLLVRSEQTYHTATRSSWSPIAIQAL